MSIGVIALSLALAAAAGVMRGITGFGGAMVLAAPLAALVGPQQAVVISVLLEAFAAVHMVPGALRTGSARLVVPVCLAACFTVPFGGYLLVTLDPELMRRSIAVVVIAFALVMLAGYRYHGTPRMSTSVAVGAASGLLAGSTSVGGPPVILYFLSGPQPIAVTRANLTLTIMLVSLAAVLALWVGGAVDAGTVTLALAMAIPFFLGVWAGSLAFRLVDEKLFRRIALWSLIAISAIVVTL